MYFQAAYIDGNFWKISTSVSPFVKANLTFGLIYEAKSKVDLDETRTVTPKVVFFFVYERF